MNQTKQKPPGRVKSAIAGALAGWIGVPLGLESGAFWSAWFGGRNFTGESVTVNSTLQLSTAWACVRLLADTLSTLPLNVYRESGDTKTLAKDHELYRLLHTRPNADMTAAVFWQVYVACLMLWGAAYVEKRRNVTGGLTALDILQPACMKPPRVREDGRVEWRYADPVLKRERVIPEDDLWYLPAFTLDGLNALSPVQMGANVFGGAIAADRASAATFKDGMKSAGLVTMDAVLKPGQRDDIRKHVKTVSDEGGYMVLEKGAGFQQLKMNPQDAELLATRGFNVEEICRWYRVPPWMVGHTEKSTSWGTGIEQQMIGFVTFSLRPWAVRIEQSISKDLVRVPERDVVSAEFALEGLLRGDSASRAGFYSQMTQNGIYTRDDCRKKENMPPMGGNADVLTVQSNLVPIDKLGENNPATTAKDALAAWLTSESSDAT
ncbi:phage portal protein [Cupriavidus sp.]|uniref:phage portal protein n=2 Tax=Cupriavidus sp. TaxID=1873897 RepID=UPI0025C152F0|nr:phage portal protein [Cupriavidus sp.]MCA3201973.1 phage portal protein [Cupriavidus sp.]